MRTLAVLPVKRFGAAKQRLETRLAPAARAELAEAMLADVLAAASAAHALAAVAVVTGEPRAVRLAGVAGAEVVPAPREAGQSAAAADGIGYTLAAGFERVLLLPGDTPLVAASDLDGLLARAAADALAAVVVPDRHGTGTNALVLSPPDALVPSFGPDSLARHRAGAEAASLAWRVERVAALAHDVDTPEDLDALARAIRSAGRQRARRTREVLARTHLVRTEPGATAAGAGP
jgi:2-phospho-L-lactate/phosphoenolpyruvate guanylyltransferase